MKLRQPIRFRPWGEGRGSCGELNRRKVEVKSAQLSLRSAVRFQSMLVLKPRLVGQTSIELLQPLLGGGEFAVCGATVHAHNS